MSDFVLRPMTAADLPSVLAVQRQCYRPELIESADALASRLALDPQLCWVAVPAQTAADGSDGPARTAPAIAAYLVTHRWPRETVPPLNAVLEPAWTRSPADRDPALTWFVHDMAVAPAAQGHGLAARLYEAACRGARQLGLRCSRLIAVQAAARWWERLGYAPVPLQAEEASKLGRYGNGAVAMERALAP